MKILATIWGNATTDQQQRLVEDALHTTPVHAIIGNAVMNEVAPNAIKQAQRSNTAVVGDYLNTGNLQLLKSGDMTAAPLQGSVATTVIGVDQAVRVLQKMPFDKRLTAKQIVVTKDTLGKIEAADDEDDCLAGGDDHQIRGVADTFDQVRRVEEAAICQSDETPSSSRTVARKPRDGGDWRPVRSEGSMGRSIRSSKGSERSGRSRRNIEEGVQDCLFGQVPACEFGHDDALPHDINPIRQVQNLRQFGRDERDRGALRHELGHQIIDFDLGADVDSDRRLVEDVDLGRPAQTPYQHDFLAVATRQRRNRTFDVHGTETQAGRDRPDGRPLSAPTKQAAARELRFANCRHGRVLANGTRKRETLRGAIGWEIAEALASMSSGDGRAIASPLRITCPDLI